MQTSRAFQVPVINSLTILSCATSTRSGTLPAAPEKIAVRMIGLGGLVIPELNGCPIGELGRSLIQKRLRAALPEQQPFWGYETKILQTSIRWWLPVACIAKGRPRIVRDFLDGTAEREWMLAKKRRDLSREKIILGEMTAAFAHIHECHFCRWEKMALGIPERHCNATMSFLLGSDVIQELKDLRGN